MLAGDSNSPFAVAARPELKVERAVAVEHLHAVVARVGHDDRAAAHPMHVNALRRRELPRCRAGRAALAGRRAVRRRELGGRVAGRRCRGQQERRRRGGNGDDGGRGIGQAGAGHAVAAAHAGYKSNAPTACGRQVIGAGQRARAAGRGRRCGRATPGGAPLSDHSLAAVPRTDPCTPSPSLPSPAILPGPLAGRHAACAQTRAAARPRSGSAAAAAGRGAIAGRRAGRPAPQQAPLGLHRGAPPARPPPARPRPAPGCHARRAAHADVHAL